MPGPVCEDGSLNTAAIVLLHAVSGVDAQLLRAVRIRPSRSNWLHAPWYRHARGGAITVGRTIWFTGIWFDPRGLGDGSLPSARRWLLHLAHEVGHLPQAERFGRGVFAKTRYIAAFTWQYACCAILPGRHYHDDSPLEREADLGRAVLEQLLGPVSAPHPLLAAVQRCDTTAVAAWCSVHSGQIATLQARCRGKYPV